MLFLTSWHCLHDRAPCNRLWISPIFLSSWSSMLDLNFVPTISILQRSEATDDTCVCCTPPAVQRIQKFHKKNRPEWAIHQFMVVCGHKTVWSVTRNALLGGDAFQQFTSNLRRLNRYLVHKLQQPTNDVEGSDWGRFFFTYIPSLLATTKLISSSDETFYWGVWWEDRKIWSPNWRTIKELPLLRNAFYFDLDCVTINDGTLACPRTLTVKEVLPDIYDVR